MLIPEGLSTLAIRPAFQVDWPGLVSRIFTRRRLIPADGHCPQTTTRSAEARDLHQARIMGTAVCLQTSLPRFRETNRSKEFQGYVHYIYLWRERAHA